MCLISGFVPSWYYKPFVILKLLSSFCSCSWFHAWALTRSKRIRCVVSDSSRIILGRRTYHAECARLKESVAEYRLVSSTAGYSAVPLSSVTDEDDNDRFIREKGFGMSTVGTQRSYVHRQYSNLEIDGCVGQRKKLRKRIVNFGTWNTQECKGKMEKVNPQEIKKIQN